MQNQTDISEAALTALKFVNNTNRNVFLTGKAGTGKTTFLKKIVEFTHKKVIVAAPTGIAAINAGGVTLHSLFQLPFGGFVPVNNFSFSETPMCKLNTPHALLKNQKIHVNKRELIRKAELLIIDEVSMLRADLLDAIDVTLRNIRRKRAVPFGGLQILFIGDLLQLPPVVKDNEWNYLKQFYQSMYFFDALALKENYPVYVELDKIYRQSDSDFIDILNNLRDNKLNLRNAQRLNEQYEADVFEKENKGYVYLTTHNYKADERNQKKLEELKEKSYVYEAEILYDFPEHLYPIDECLELKVGAQVMFIKNDPSGKGLFFNGKIGFVDELDEDEIIVGFDDNSESVQVERYTWENIKFSLNKSTNEIEENVKGTFSQYPLKLAWAITIHKSQGLTFEKAIIDVSGAFAPGQVYVALSRLTSLNGLKLAEKIPIDVINIDEKLIQFSNQKKTNSDLMKSYEKDSKQYLFSFIREAFNFATLKYACQRHLESYDKDIKRSEKQKYKQWASQILDEVTEFCEVGSKFLKQITKIEHIPNNESIDYLFKRVKAASDYFSPILNTFSQKIKTQIKQIQKIKGIKTYQNELRDLELNFFNNSEMIRKSCKLIEVKLKNEQLSKKELNSDKFLDNRESFDDKLGKKKPKEKKEKKEKIPTHEISFNFFKAGKNIDEIAKIRNFVPSTIENHLIRYIKSGEINAEDLLASEKIQIVFKFIEELKTLKLNSLKNSLDETFTFNELRFATAAYIHKFGEEPFE